MTTQFKGKVIQVADDLLGVYPFSGVDGDRQVVAAELRVYADANSTSNAVPARFEVWTANSSGTLTRAFTLTSSQAATFVGAATFSAGIVGTSKPIFETIPIGPVAYGSLGTSTSATAASIYVADIWIPYNTTLTGIKWLQGAQIGEGSSIAALYNASGELVANSTTNGLSSSAANTFLDCPFTASYSATPGRYFIGIQQRNDNPIRLIAANTYVNVFTSITAGVFGTLGSITPPTSFTALAGPIAYAY